LLVVEAAVVVGRPPGKEAIMGANPFDGCSHNKMTVKAIVVIP
jgi:hypothetical protein